MSEDVETEWPDDRKWSAGSIVLKSRTVSASEISARLGITADRQFERGTLMNPRNPANSRRRQNSVWVLTSGLANNSDLADHVRALLGLVDGCRDELAQLAADCELTLSLGFGSENGQGGCLLPADLLADIAALRLDILLDLYPPRAPEFR
ncbi:DUF4279 domain-containing protein [Nocardia sp. NPDC056100]|uniref:DUF4279 domain-containing protein n=1 Tax=Nocardia sp. NPDC056100 TaxID=3345712 RepID=UPI0035D6150C